MRTFPLSLLLVLVLWISPGMTANEASAGAPASATEAVPDAPANPARRVQLGDDVLVTLSHRTAKRSPEARAQDASQALKEAVTSSRRGEVEVRWATPRDPQDPTRKLADIAVGSSVVLELFADDLAPSDARSPEEGVERVVSRIRAALEEEQERTKIAAWVLSGSSVVFLGLLALLLLRGVGTWARTATQWTEDEARAIGAIRVGTIELIPAGAVREGARVGLIAGVWLLRAAIVYFWIIWSLSLFDATRGFAESATGTLLQPLVELLRRIASHIPVAVALLISLFLIALLMRLVAAYFHAIERGELESEWAQRETARVTGGLLLIGLALATLLFVAPLLTGATEGVFSQLGLLALGILALSTLPMLVSCALGVRLVYSRALRLGDELEYGGQRGIIRQIGLFDVTLAADDGGTVRVPHLMSLWHATRIHAREERGSAKAEP